MAKDQSKKRWRRRRNEEKKKPVTSRQKVSPKEPSMEEWVTALATKAASASSSGGQQAAEASSASIERRLEKKRRRNDRLLARVRDQQVKEAARMAKGAAAALEAKAKRGQKRKRVSREWDTTGTVSAGDCAAEKSIVRKNDKITGSRLPIRQWESPRTSSSSSVTLSRLSAAVLRTADGWDKVRRPKQYIDPTNEAKGKASKRSKYEPSNIQPSVGSYGGLGFARPSLYLHLLDPSFVPKFREEYAEHIPGFFGKARSKVMKKQLDGDMLWRKLLEKKRGGPGGGTDKDWAEEKYRGKRIKDMHPDARVDALIRLGFL